MRTAIMAMGIGLTACTQIPTSSGAPTAGNAPAGAQQAYFPDYPERLFFAAGAVCDGPGQTIVRPNLNEVRCESFPKPEMAAAIILNFSGTVEDLPKLVTTLVGRDTPAGYLVTADNYIRVPQRTGPAQLVRFPMEDMNAEMSEVFRAAGGRPL